MLGTGIISVGLLINSIEEYSLHHQVQLMRRMDIQLFMCRRKRWQPKGDGAAIAATTVWYSKRSACDGPGKEATGAPIVANRREIITWRYPIFLNLGGYGEHFIHNHSNT